MDNVEGIKTSGCTYESIFSLAASYYIYTLLHSLMAEKRVLKTKVKVVINMLTVTDRRAEEWQGTEEYTIFPRYTYYTIPHYRNIPRNERMLQRKYIGRVDINKMCVFVSIHRLDPVSSE